MKSYRPSLWAIRLTLAGAAALSAIAPAAHADKPLQLSFKEAEGYGRITAKWGDGDETAPKIAASVEGADQVLILRFDQKVSVNLEAVRQGLPGWASATRMDADGKTIRIGLKQTSRLHVSTSVDLSAVDLLPKEAKADPPDIVSPLAAKRAQEAEAKRIAMIAPPPAMEQLEVRGSQSGDSSRISFYWPNKVTYKVVGQGEGMLKLLFSKRAKADLAYLHILPPPNLADFKAENTDKGYLVTITSKDYLPLKPFFESDVFVVDITRPAPPESDPESGRDKAKPALPKPEPVAAKPKDDEKPLLLAPPRSLIRSDEEIAAEAAAKAAADAKALADATLGGIERVTDLATSWSDPAPKSGVIDVKIVPLASGLELEVPFAAPAPAAVFSRGAAVWAVFAANADLKVDQVALPAGYKVRVMRVKNAALMRIEGPKGLTVSAEAEESTWNIRLAPTAIKPQRFLKPERKAGDGGRARIETMLVGAAGLVWFEDPVVGDMVAAIVAYGPSSASPTPRDFVEGSLPATAHGLAIAPKSDAVAVTIEGERVVVSMMAGAQTAIEKPTDDKAPKVAVNPAMIDFGGWGQGQGKSFTDRQFKLIEASSNIDPATADGAAKMMDLARFYLGHELAMEALGVFKVALAERPELEQDPEFLGLRGAANYMAHRLAAADADLSSGPLRGDSSAALWRALVAVDRSDWERAGDYFRAGSDQLLLYKPDKAASFSAAWAEAALNTNDYDLARRQAEQAIANGDRETVERGKLVLARLASIIEGPGAAYPELERLSKDASEQIAVRAELRRLDAGVASGAMTANAAAGELELLRYRWRGDEVEMATVGILADQYMRVGRFRDALLLAQSTALRDEDMPGSRELRIRLSDYFRRLFLNGEADRLDPIQALALFYEFSEALIPSGADGDQMARKLAQRLVAFDLLEPAAKLLQYQVDNRMRGISKAAVAVDLATIYLWDKRPDKAIVALNSTRLPGLPKDLAIERRLLEAAAYRDLGRYDHVVELVEPLEGAEAKSLLADAYLRDRKWADAARVYMAMMPAQPQQATVKDADAAFRAAIAARMTKDPALLAEVRRYSSAMDGSANKASFDLITSQVDASSQGLSEAVKRLADAPRVDAFSAALKKRFEAPKVAAATAAASPAVAPPAATSTKPAAAAPGQSASSAPAVSGGAR